MATEAKSGVSMGHLHLARTKRPAERPGARENAPRVQRIPVRLRRAGAECDRGGRALSAGVESDPGSGATPRPTPTPSAPRRAAPAARFTARDVGSLLIVLLGVAVLATVALFNPLVGRLIWHEHVVDKLDVLTRYAWTGALLGSGIIGLGLRIGRRTDGSADGSSIFAVLVCLFVLVDRLLLVNFGLPLWIHDPVLHYRHRPDAVRTLARARRPHDLVRINSWGHHDTDFPRAKPAGELRGLMVGDSVTMGDQLVYGETFTALLEERLRAEPGAYSSFEMINAGVHGYTTYQEVEVLRESMVFDPDFIVVGFCLNDLTDPTVVARGQTDRGDDYHHVAATASPLQGWFLNETGFGRLVQELRATGRTRVREEKLELDGVRRISTAPPDAPEWAETWRFVLGDLDEMARIAREAGRPLILLVFPFTFQLLEDDARAPQARLVAHARQLGIDVIDFTPIFAARVYQDRELLALLRSRGVANERIERIFEAEIRRDFLDNDHLAPSGHAVVAEVLHAHLAERGLLRASTGDAR